MRTLCLWAAPAVLVACSHKSETELAPVVAPELAMSAPAPADWRADGQMIATGSFAGLTSVEVNGVPAVVSGAQWTAEVGLARGVNVVEVRGVDSTGTSHYVRNGVLAGDFGSSAEPVRDGLVARVNRGGLDFLLDTVGQMIDAETLNAMVAGTTVYSDSYGILGWNAVEVQADVGWLWFEPLQLDVDPRSGAADLEIDIPVVDVWVPVSGSVVGFDFDVDAWVWCDDAVITGTIDVDVRDGQLVADLSNLDVELRGFDFDTSLLPGGIESWLLVDTVRGALEEMLLEKIELLLPPLLESQLADLELAFETELMGTPLSVQAGFVDASIDSEGLEIVADVNASSPENGTHGAVGPLVAPEARAETDRFADFGLSLSDDLLNRFVFELWAGGLMDLGLSTADGSLDAVLLHQLGARDEAEIHVFPVLPPVMVERDGAAQLQLTELEVEILTPGGEHGERIVLAVTLLVDVELAVSNGIVSLSLGEPDVSFIVRENDWNVRNETLTNALAEAIPVDALLGLLGELEFPLPSLGGISVAGAEVGREKGGSHTGVSLTLR